VTRNSTTITIFSCSTITLAFGRYKKIADAEAGLKNDYQLLFKNRGSVVSVRK